MADTLAEDTKETGRKCFMTKDDIIEGHKNTVIKLADMKYREDGYGTCPPRLGNVRSNRPKKMVIRDLEELEEE